jgi:hypothetical protein
MEGKPDGRRMRSAPLDLTLTGLSPSSIAALRKVNLFSLLVAVTRRDSRIRAL